MGTNSSKAARKGKLAAAQDSMEVAAAQSAAALPKPPGPLAKAAAAVASPAPTPPPSNAVASSKMEFDEFSPSPVLEDIHKYYVIDDEVLGRGQYGEVRKATHRQNKGSYVVKSILKQKIRRPEVLRKEMEFLLRVEHPNICNVVDVFDTRDAFHIVQDFYSGGELFDRIVETYNEGSHFSEEQVCEMVQHMLNGIEYCHETVGICHRDLKPENILFRSPDSLDLVIIDFGLSADVEVGAADGEGGGGAGGGGGGGGGGGRHTATNPRATTCARAWAHYITWRRKYLRRTTGEPATSGPSASSRTL